MSEARKITVDPGIARELTAFQQNILVILAEEARYGLAIKRELEEYYGEEVNHGRLYPNLDDLVEMGLVEKSELDKRTNQYALTDAGETAVIGQLEDGPRSSTTSSTPASRTRIRYPGTPPSKPLTERPGRRVSPRDPSRRPVPPTPRRPLAGPRSATRCGRSTPRRTPGPPRRWPVPPAGRSGSP